MLSASDITAIAILAAGLGVPDITRIPQHQPDVLPTQLWLPTPRQPDPDIQTGQQWLDRQAAERDKQFRDQQRQQAEQQREMLLERRHDADRRLPQDRPGWPGWQGR